MKEKPKGGPGLTSGRHTDLLPLKRLGIISLLMSQEPGKASKKALVDLDGQDELSASMEAPVRRHP